MNPIGSICVAGCYFALYNNSDSVLVFETGFEDFLSKDIHDQTRKIIFQVGFNSFETVNTRYQAINNHELLWEIVDTEKGRWYFIYHPENGSLQQQAKYEPSNKTWTIYSTILQEQNESVLHPLAYPMSPIIWYVLTTEEPMLLVHASGVFDGEKGRLFAGFSGVGKSTMAGIWQNNGAIVINDDRLLIKKEVNGEWHICNTPMYYHAVPKSAQLHYIYFPFHSPVNTYENLSGAKAIAQLLAFTIHHGYDAKHLLHHSSVAESLLQDISAAKLGVVPTHEIISFIKSHD